MLNNTEYTTYMRSDAWRSKRALFLASDDGKKCHVCNEPYKKGSHVHHRTYKRFGDEDLSKDLVLACEPCHVLIHEIARETKMSVWDATDHAREIWLAKTPEKKPPAGKLKYVVLGSLWRRVVCGDGKTNVRKKAHIIRGKRALCKADKKSGKRTFMDDPGEHDICPECLAAA